MIGRVLAERVPLIMTFDEETAQMISDDLASDIFYEVMALLIKHNPHLMGEE